MAITKILVPDMGDFKDVEIIEVLVKEGQQIKKNDSLITLESDKSSVEVPSTHEGTIEKIEIKVGDKVNKGDLILSLNSEINIDAKKKTINTTINEENKIQVKKNKPIKNKEIIPAIPSSKSGVILLQFFPPSIVIWTNPSSAPAYIISLSCGDSAT